MRPQRFFDGLSDLFAGKWWDVLQAVVAGAVLLSIAYGAYRFIKTEQAINKENEKRYHLTPVGGLPENAPRLR